ncbi:aldehyde dehydrogenase [Bacillus horti]|uniref:Aldehyde dehydrogenase n=1 Tax=Caldalkalibacillus horti TaxID=77523 RepID=A0ABT9VW16_9BACI|nr:aldehyde dehydrogenase [Bacillus horti]MDQ0165189.1 aldehyde dehydrogenase (NAD+) [Bacillus horti]
MVAGQEGKTLEYSVQKQKDYFISGATKSVSKRLEQLQLLKEGIKEFEQDIVDALKQDLNKSEYEAYTTEVGILLEEIKFTEKRLHKWAKPKKVKTAITHIGSKGMIISEPYGVVLIIAPWNYPFQLAISPLIGAIAAGNTAIIKPSELTPHISKVIVKLIEKVFKPEYVTVIEGGVETSTELLKQPFDYIFFTGSVQVGKVVMEAAAKNLTPVTLELGGKSPCILHDDADIKLAAKRVLFGKFTNAGQTCIAPDYLLMPSRIKAEFIEECKRVLQAFYGEDPVQSDRYGRIVSERHFDRLLRFMGNGNVVIGGQYDREALKIAPTFIDQVSWEDPIMQEEIFGPLLPILEYESIDQCIAKIVERPKPLALYLFTKDTQLQEKVMEQVSFGGGCINDTLMHIGTPYLPFGGVGESGMGSYHGKQSFKTFSHEKSVLKQTNRFDMEFRYPSSKNGLKLIKKLWK